MSKPQGQVPKGYKAAGDGILPVYDREKLYDDAVTYYGAIDFVSRPPQAVVKLDKLQSQIEQYG